MNLHKDLYNYFIVNTDYTFYRIPYHSYYIFSQSSYNYIN